MLRIEVTPYDIAFRRPLVTAAGTFARRCGAIVRVTDSDGCCGIGEAAPHPGAPRAVLERCVEALRAVPPQDCGRYLEQLPAPAAVALETASLDLEARRAGVPLAHLLGGPYRGAVTLNALIAEPAPAAAARAASAGVERGFRCFKLKVPPAGAGSELPHVVREAVGAEVALRIDVNGEATVAESIEMLRGWLPAAPEYVEQPVRSPAELAAVRRAVAVRLAADECVADADSIEELARRRAADVVVLKPALLGIRTSLELARLTASLGLDVVVTSVLESSVGIAAALHVAAAVPERLLACGLATAELLERDLVLDPPRIERGEMLLPAGSGLGVTPAA